MCKSRGLLGLMACVLVLGAWGHAAENLAAGKPYTASVEAAASFSDSGGELTDGTRGSSSNHLGSAWQGRSKKSFHQVMDLETPCSVKKVTVTFMRNTAKKIVFPSSVECYYKEDEGYVKLGTATSSIQGNYGTWTWKGSPVETRHLMVKIQNPGGWVFQDEVEVWGDVVQPSEEPPGDLNYSTSEISLVKGKVMNKMMPSYTGNVESWSIRPSLPAGLVFSSENGSISGTPQQLQENASYSVMATNSFGSARTQITIAILEDGNHPGQGELPYPLYGITVDDSWDETAAKKAQIIEAIKAMAVKPTVRIVMTDDRKASSYASLFKALHRVAYVMACPVDSDYMKKHTTIQSYVDRFADSYSTLSPYVDLWEIGNEINGEGWLGDNKQFVADKAYAAYNYISENGGRTVLTSYMFRPGDQSMTMGAWLKKYIPDDMKAGLDYLMVSYYEDDNGGYQPDWVKVFKEMQSIFPKSKLAIGECGNTAKGATTSSRIQMAKRYYTMPNPVKNYVGGYFWWNWVKDCVPHKGNSVWQEINTGMQKQPAFEAIP